MVDELVPLEQRSGSMGVVKVGKDVHTATSLFQYYWNEPCTPVDIMNFNPKYHVPELRHNGSRRGEQIAWWVLSRSASFVVSFFDRGSWQTIYPKTGWITFGNGSVSGQSADGRAVQIAKNINADSNLWLAWSANHIAIFDYGENGEIWVRWHASTPHMPQYSRHSNHMTLTWPDQSAIDFKMTLAQKSLLRDWERGRSSPVDPRNHPPS